MFYRTGIIAELYRGIGIVDLSCSCDLDLDPMTFIYEPDLYSQEIYRMCENKLPTSRSSLWKVIVLQLANVCN